MSTSGASIIKLAVSDDYSNDVGVLKDPKPILRLLYSPHGLVGDGVWEGVNNPR